MNIVKYFGIALIFLGLVAVYFLFSIAYVDFIVVISDVVGVTDKSSNLKNVLTEQVHFLIKLFSLVPIAIGLFVFFKHKRLAYYASQIILLISGIIFEVRSINKKSLFIMALILLIAIIYRLYYAISFPVSYDEAWTYINFTEKGLLSSISFYPSPNNHVLHSVLTNLSYYLPFTQTVNLRLPSIIISVFSVFIFYLSFRKLFNDKISIYLTLMFSFLYPVIYYGYLARGYSLIILSFIISFYGTLRLAEVVEKRGEARWRYLFYLSFGAVLGLYSNPSFLYPYFSLTTFLVLIFVYCQDNKALKRLLVSMLIVTAITIALYSPIFIVSGFWSIASNPDVQTIPRIDVMSDLYDHFISTIRFMFYYEWMFWVIVFLSIFSLINTNNNYKIKLAVYAIFISPLILLAHSVIPFERTWVYLVIPVLFLLGVFINHFFAKGGRVITISVVMVVIASGVSYGSYIRDYRVSEAANMTVFSFEADKLSKFLISKNANKIYVSHPTLDAHIAYSYNENNIPLDLVYSRKLEDKILIKNSFDYIITDVKVNQILGYKYLKKICTLCSTHGEESYVYIKI